MNAEIDDLIAEAALAKRALNEALARLNAAQADFTAADDRCSKAHQAARKMLDREIVDAAAEPKETTNAAL